jgi:hypothetical protein
MINQIVVFKPDSSTSFARPKLHKGQIENQNQIKEGQPLWIHGPNNSVKGVIVIRGPFNCNGTRSVTLLSIDSQDPAQTINLADLAVVAYMNGKWNIDNWLGKF